MTQKVRLHISCNTKSTSIVFGPSKACPLDVILAGGVGPGRGIPMIVFGLCAPTVVNMVRHRLKYRIQDGHFPSFNPAIIHCFAEASTKSQPISLASAPPSCVETSRSVTLSLLLPTSITGA